MHNHINYCLVSHIAHIYLYTGWFTSYNFRKLYHRPLLSKDSHTYVSGFELSDSYGHLQFRMKVKENWKMNGIK
jgi:hypothetical protein